MPEAPTLFTAWESFYVIVGSSGAALTGLQFVVMALIGLLGSLFIRPRRVWVRARREGDGTLVEVAALDRSGGGDTAVVVAELAAALRGEDKS